MDLPPADITQNDCIDLSIYFDFIVLIFFCFVNEALILLPMMIWNSLDIAQVGLKLGTILLPSFLNIGATGIGHHTKLKCRLVVYF